MTIGHNTMSVSMLAIATGGGGVIWGAVSPPCALPLEALAISLIPGFQIGRWNLHSNLASPCMTKVHAVDFHHSLLFLSRDKLWQLLYDPTDFISSTLIDENHAIGQD